MKKKEEDGLEITLKNTYHEINMTLEIMKLKNKYFMNLVAF